MMLILKDGIMCLGDKVKVSEVPGKAEAIRYDKLDERQFGIRSVGKVIKLYENYDKVQILIDIE